MRACGQRGVVCALSTGDGMSALLYLDTRRWVIL